MRNFAHVKKVAVLGLGKSGVSALPLCSRLGIGAHGFDERKIPDAGSESAQCLKKAGIETSIWDGGGFGNPDIFVVSPGLGTSSIMRACAEKYSAPLVGELEFAAFFCKSPLIAISGTNGKTTTTELTSHLLRSLGFRSVCAGNIGVPLSDFAAVEESPDWIAVEVSSFQLETVESIGAHSAAILNIESDHMDRHGTLDGYARTKFKIFSGIENPSNCVIRRDLLGHWRRFSPIPPEKPFTFSISDESAEMKYIPDSCLISVTGAGIRRDFKIADARLKGAHNIENMMAALALVLNSVPNSDLAALETALCEFRGAEHRIEIFAEKDGIAYVNDSKGTNPDSVRAALRTVGGSKNVILIAGGLDKDMDFSPIVEEISRIKSFFIVGECKNKLFDLFNKYRHCRLFERFDDAVQASCDAAECGDVVLLSPGCASMDMFRDYKERGEIFKQIVKRRLGI